MGKLRPAPDANHQVTAYRDLAREALDSVAVYNARAQWFDRSGNPALASEYRQLSQEALDRAQRYKELGDLADEQLKRVRFETLGKPVPVRTEPAATPVHDHEPKSISSKSSSAKSSSAQSSSNDD
jgi:hypothetical protein